MNYNVIKGDNFYNGYDNNNDNDIVFIHSIHGDSRIDSVSDNRTGRNKNTMETIRTGTNVVINVFRYKFTDEFMVELFQFSKVHQYDHRNVFKEAWNEWMQENEELIRREINRLQNLNYEGDILTKMFKSARYYFRKKGTEKKEPIERRCYISIGSSFLELIDQHIVNHIQNPDYKPSEGFVDFCSENRDSLKEEVTKMVNLQLSLDVIKEKIKKTYKNRYFIFINRNRINDE
jgi:hypothetical protein